jgi:hypothetical protein
MGYLSACADIDDAPVAGQRAGVVAVHANYRS